MKCRRLVDKIMIQWKQIVTLVLAAFFCLACLSCIVDGLADDGSTVRRNCVVNKLPSEATPIFHDNDPTTTAFSISRRNAMHQTTAAAMATATAFTTRIPSARSTATSEDMSAASPMSTINDLLLRLKPIPTFCIVDQQGAAYMVFKNDQALAVGYAFTTFPGALAVLSDAQRNAKEKGYFDVWKDATITVIPLDIAVRLTLKKKTRKSPKDQELDTLLMVIPGADDRTDGMAIDGRFKDQGKVPLFYIDTSNDGMSTSKDDPVNVYFARKDLLADWNRRNPGQPLPPVKAIDLVGIFENTLRGRIDYLPTTNLNFVPIGESMEAAKEMKSRGMAPYNPSRMII